MRNKFLSILKRKLLSFLKILSIFVLTGMGTLSVLCNEDVSTTELMHTQRYTKSKTVILKDELEWMREEAVLACFNSKLLLKICWWGRGVW